jgi:hypothetical protein
LPEVKGRKGRKGRKDGRERSAGQRRMEIALRQCGVERRELGFNELEKGKGVKFERRTEMRLKRVLG